MTLLRVAGLRVRLRGPAGPVEAVRGIGFSLERGQTLGIVGESGCGKSMTALALLGLLPEGGAIEGSVRFEGRELAGLADAELCRLRGNRIAMVFQEPMTALNPLHTIGRQIAEPLRLHRGLSAQAARAEAGQLLQRVGMPNAFARLDAYPHQLSGGQRQRALIAVALSCGPDLLIADEPTTALDVTIQAQILELIVDLVRERGMALILISHDLGVIAETVDRVAVMYAGRIVEQGPVAAVFARLAHPYSRGLFAAIPRLGGGRSGGGSGRLAAIPGRVPDLAALPTGCAFAGRCAFAVESCRHAEPPEQAVGPEHSAVCGRLDVVLAAAR